MSLPLKGRRATGTLHEFESVPMRGFVLQGEASEPKRVPMWKNWRTPATVSLIVHAVLLLVLSWIVFDLPRPSVLDSIFALIESDKRGLGDEIDVDVDVVDTADVPVDPDASSPFDEPMLSEEDLTPEKASSLEGSSFPRVSITAIEKSQAPQQKAPARQVASAKSSSKGSATGTGIDVDGLHSDHFIGRSPAGKAALLKRMGGTDASEAAVGRGLVWLKNHQLVDGSWSFYHLENPRCDCTMPGRLANNPNGATAMALLAFLGAGQTHESGEYQEEVGRGIEFLLKSGRRVEKGICYYGSLEGPPTYYTHGLVTIALSEAFAMTHDARLRPAVAGSIEFLTATQDAGGGWRYFPGQPGDLSVVAWQLMAMKSAQFSRIMVPPKVFYGIDRFLSSVASQRGSQYSYMPERRGPTPSMTAAGLLCRMYMDWKESSPSLKAGVHFLDEHGPELDDMYYNYYATQVLHHWGGPEWDRWNDVMRDHLIKTQIRTGHATGSWDVADRHGVMGGRLYMTSLVLLTLEVYYRHLPLYQKDRIEIPLTIEKPAAERVP